jgi:hypothetical protein
MFNNIESKISGGTNDTQPYNTFKSSLNSIYDYFSVIFVSNKENNEKYQASVDNLDKPCDCSKYKCKEGDSEENDDIYDMDNIDEMEELQDLEENENDEKEAKLKENVESKLLLKTSKIV